MIMNSKAVEIFETYNYSLEYVAGKFPHLYEDYKILKIKESHRPEEKSFAGKLNERNVSGETRKRTRPWDNCWFSNKPHIIILTVEEAYKRYPSYILWCYKNLSIKWSVHTIKMFESGNTDNDFNYGNLLQNISR
jgi:hypothetical protein